MTDQDMRHLEMIQGVINRMAQNSFAYKGWAITLVAALFAIGITRECYFFFLLALLPTFSFWGLDSYYLRQERLYRQLYDAVRNGISESAFCMDTTPFYGKVQTWLRTLISRTVIWLYLLIAVLIILISVMLWRHLG